MIRVLVKASTSIARAGLESLLRAHPSFRLVPESSDGYPADGPALESQPDVLLVETETLADNSAREAMDFAEAGGPVVLLVRNPAAEPVSEALRAGVKAVLSSGLRGPQVVAAIEAAAMGLVVLHGADVELLLRTSNTVSSEGSEALIEALEGMEVKEGDARLRCCGSLRPGSETRRLRRASRSPNIPSSSTSPPLWESWARPVAPRP